MTRQLYLNHAGTSWPKPAAVTAAVQDALSCSPARWPERFEEAHQALARFLGIRQPEQLLLTPGCTSALAVGIGDALIPAGKCVLTSQWEHHAVQRPLRQLAASGVPVESIPSRQGPAPQTPGGPLDLDWLEQRLTRDDVALIAITAACNVTGELLPYREVIRIAHQRGVQVLVDGAQIVGWQRLDLPGIGADLFAFGGHKGLQAPWGIGGLYVSDRAQLECSSAACELPAAGPPGGRNSRPGYCDVGSVDQIALAGLQAAVQMLEQQDPVANLANARRQIRKIRERLMTFDGIRIFGPGGSEQGMPSLALSVAGCSSSEVADRLGRHAVVVGSGLQCAPQAHQTLGTLTTGLVRLSSGPGQPDQELDEAVERIEAALRGGI